MALRALPPLPDPAKLNDPGHIDDSAQLAAFLKALAEDHAVTIPDVPAPDPDHPGHIDWHHLMVQGTKAVSEHLHIPVDLPPLDPKAGDTGHTTHHNTLRAALLKLSEEQPFIVDGGEVLELDGYRFHYFTKPGTYTLNVTGSGQVKAVVLGGGGGGADAFGGAEAFQYGGPGGAGGMELDETGDAPSIVLTSGTYTVQVGKGGQGQGPSATASNGTDSKLTGNAVALVGAGGGGGGTGVTNANDGGCGGGGGMRSTGGSIQYSKGGRGSQNGNGADGAPNEYGTPQQGGAGGVGGSAKGYQSGDEWDYHSLTVVPWDAAIPTIAGADDYYSRNAVQFGAGGNASARKAGVLCPGTGGMAIAGANYPAGDGAVIIAYALPTAKEWQVRR